MKSSYTTKKQLRTQMKQLLANLPLKEKEHQSAHICTQLQDIFSDPQIQRIGLIVPLPNEPDIRSVIERCWIKKKKLYFPKIENGIMYFVIADSRDDFIPDKLFERNILVPQGKVVDVSLDLLVVPGLAFDETGGRMGKGGGRYDRYLERYPELRTIGLCFREQLVDYVPMEKHDKKVQQTIYG